MSDIRRISADDAHACMQQGHTFVDVRTEEEFDAGHPAGALNVPFMLSVQGTMLPNAEFLSVMTRAFPKDARIVLGCAAGTRSARAATALASEWARRALCGRRSALRSRPRDGVLVLAIVSS